MYRYVCKDVKERLCVVISACFGWIQFYIFTFCLICFVDFSWFFYIWSPFWCCPAGNISRLKEFYIRRLSQNPRQTPRCQLGCYDLHVGKKRFANMFPAMLIYVVSSCNCLSHFHSFSLLSRKCPPQQWRERERESNKNMLTVCSVAHPERMVSILVPAVLRLAGTQKWKVPNPSMRSMWLARCCCPVHWAGWVGLPTKPLNKDTYWSPWGRFFSIFFLELQPIICALVLQSWVQNKLLQTGQ